MKKSIMIFALIILLLINIETLLKEYAGLFYINNATKGADAIIILGGGVHTRPEHAVKLYKDNYGKRVYVTNISASENAYPNIFKSDTELTFDIFEFENIPLIKIPNINDRYATSTFDEAHDVYNHFKDYENFHLIIVTDDFHSRRALYAFKKVFSNYKRKWIIEISAVDSKIYTQSNWWKTEKGLRKYLLEPIKFLFYFFNNKTTDYINKRN